MLDWRVKAIAQHLNIFGERRVGRPAPGDQTCAVGARRRPGRLTMSERPDQLQPLSELLRAYSPELSQDFYARMRARPWQAPRRGAGGQRWAHWWGLGLMIMLAALVVPTVRATVTGWLGRAPDEFPS